jgi:hypothetical protein
VIRFTRRHLPEPETLVNKALIALAALALPLAPRAVADEPKKAEVRWEYATIVTGGRVNVRLTTGAEEVEAESWANLAEKLKLTPKGTAYQVAVLDHLGGQGWELVSHAASTGEYKAGGTSHSYTFKRRK